MDRSICWTLWHNGGLLSIAENFDPSAQMHVHICTKVLMGQVYPHVRFRLIFWSTSFISLHLFMPITIV